MFGAEVKEHLFQQVVAAQLASRRAGTSAAKERSAVQGSSKKIYKQKGTGRARHGAIRAPIFVGGGRAHPPKVQDWSTRPPRRVRVGALRSALSMIVKEGRMTVVKNNADGGAIDGAYDGYRAVIHGIETQPHVREVFVGNVEREIDEVVQIVAATENSGG